jgi:uncharacterized protein (DUF924 family)
MAAFYASQAILSPRLVQPGVRLSYIHWRRCEGRVQHMRDEAELGPADWDSLPERARAWLDFWFGAAGDPERFNHKQLWFRSTPKFDEAVRGNFASDHAAAMTGSYTGWETVPEGCLALVMLLDQVPRNIYRSTPRAYQSDALALATTNRALARGFDLRVPAAWRLFFYLPLEHSEVLIDQQRGLDLLLALPPVPGRATDGHMTRLHCEIIERFGRFPHRNVILGRESTPEELAFLDECEHRFGQPAPPQPGEKPIAHSQNR